MYEFPMLYHTDGPRIKIHLPAYLKLQFTSTTTHKRDLKYLKNNCSKKACKLLQTIPLLCEILFNEGKTKAIIVNNLKNVTARSFENISIVM